MKKILSMKRNDNKEAPPGIINHFKKEVSINTVQLRKGQTYKCTNPFFIIFSNTDILRPRYM